MYSRILVPVDLDNIHQLDKALDLAGKTAKEHDATVIFVGVVDAVPTAATTTQGSKAHDLLDEFSAEQAYKYGIKVADHVELRSDVHLNIGSEVIDAARKTESDLIIMASHVPGLKDHIISSNAGYVASNAPISVFVVR